MNHRLEQDSIENLMKAQDYRAFISVLIQERKKHRRFGYSDIARHGGFAARSFPRDVVLGKKSLSLNSLPKFIRGLGLTSDLAEYFRILVEISETKCRTKSLDETKLRQMKDNLKKRISDRHHVQVGHRDSAFVLSSVPRIYAALGNADIGSSLKEIFEKTSLSETEIHQGLGYMLEQSLIKKRGARYFANESHSNFQGLKTEIFKKHFIKTAETSIQMSKKFIGSEEKLFLSSAFSVSQKDLPKLKDELRSLLLKYVDTAENPNGNKVINLIASLY